MSASHAAAQGKAEAGSPLLPRLVASASALLPLLIALAAWPPGTHQPCDLLDCSWQFGEATLPARYVHGQSLSDFTYGPLGFVDVLADYGRVTFLLTAVFTLALFTTVAALLLVRLRALFPAVSSWWFAVPVVVILRLTTNPVEVATTAGLLVFACLVDKPDPNLRRPLRWLPLAATPGLVSLVKVSDGVSLFAVVVLAGLALAGPRPRARVAAVGGVVLASLVVNLLGFAAVTRHPSGYAHYLAASKEIGSGYVAMSGVESGLHVWRILALVLVGLVTVIALSAARLRRGQWQLALAALIVVYFTMREGLVRFDSGHALLLVSPLALVPVALASQRVTARIALLSGAVVTGIAVVAHITVLGHLDPAMTTIRSIASTARDIVTSGDEADGYARSRQTTPLPTAVLAALRGHRVQIDPVQAELAGAYGLDWDPVDVYQTYSAYTPALDRDDVSSLLAASGPDRVLRSLTDGGIDNRDSVADAPLYELAELCDFRQIARAGRWQVLARSSHRCASPRQLGTVVLQRGGTVAVPPAAAGHVVLASVRFALPLSYRVESAIFRPRETQLVLDGTPWRAVVDTAPDGIIVNARVPDLPSVDSDVTRVGRLGFTGPEPRALVTFSDVAVGP